MVDIFRDSTFGQLVRFATGDKIFKYREERPDFILPERYLASTASSSVPTRKNSSSTLAEKGDSRRESTLSPAHAEPLPLEPRVLEAGEATEQKLELKIDNAIEALAHERGVIIVDWYGDDDPENPHNWSSPKKAFVLVLVMLLTFSVYIGSAIYTSSQPYLVEEFGVSELVTTLGLSLYVIAYGIGPMIFSPFQELPSLGRNPIYLSTLIIFAILQIPTALSKNIGSLLVLRFLGGFFASPALATGGASVSDIYSYEYYPYTLALWAIAAVCGPVLGPIVGGFAAAAKGWRWPIWELAWISGFAAVTLFFLFPETLGDTILLKRAERLRKLTGNKNIKSLGEIKQENLTKSEVAVEYLVRPFQLMMEPSVFFINLYVGLGYAIFYLWFEAFPIVFVEMHHFAPGIDGLPYLGIIIGGILSYFINAAWNIWYINHYVKKHGSIEPEERLKLALFAGIMIPISLLIFGWTAREDLPWIAPIIGAGAYMPGIFLLFQSALVYLPISYPEYAASILAGNDFFRSSMAGAFPLFGRAYFKALGVGPGCTLLAGVAALMIPFLWVLIKKGAYLRSKSKYATA